MLRIQSFSSGAVVHTGSKKSHELPGRGVFDVRLQAQVSFWALQFGIQCAHHSGIEGARDKTEVSFGANQRALASWDQRERPGRPCVGRSVIHPTTYFKTGRTLRPHHEDVLA